MDLQHLNEQINDAVNRMVQAVVEYFSGLSRNEWYGWGAMGAGLVMLVAGLFLL